MRSAQCDGLSGNRGGPARRGRKKSFNPLLKGHRPITDTGGRGVEKILLEGKRKGARGRHSPNDRIELRKAHRPLSVGEENGGRKEGGLSDTCKRRKERTFHRDAEGKPDNVGGGGGGGEWGRKKAADISRLVGKEKDQSAWKKKSGSSTRKGRY